MAILVSNDDGVSATGLQILSAELSLLDEVWVVAPDRDQSGVSHSVTLQRPLRIDEIAPRVFAVDGTPTDCVNLAINGILPERPRMVVSGINHGANLNDVDMNKRTAMYNAASYGFLDCVKLLIDRGADATIGDIEGNVPIIASAYYGYEKVVRFLLDCKRGQDPDDLDRKGEKRWTGLYLSCEAGHMKIAKMFLEVGANPLIADNQGHTPLDIVRL